MGDLNPRVTVIVATYRGRYLEETLASVLRQSFTDFEVLVLDDANDAVCRALVSKLSDDRLRYFGNETNLGPAKNHAYGFGRARGQLVAVLNHDDLWEAETLSRLVEGFDSAPGVVAAFSATRVAGSDGAYDPERTRRARTAWNLDGLPNGLIDDWYRSSSQRVAFPLGPATVVRTDALRETRIPAIVGGSYDFWLGYRLARKGPVVHVADAHAYWREHDENLTRHRSFKQSLEPLYLNAVIATDRRLPRATRTRAAMSLPRRIAFAMRQGLRDLSAR